MTAVFERNLFRRRRRVDFDSDGVRVDVIEWLGFIWELNYTLIGLHSNNTHSEADCNFGGTVYVF